MCDELSNTSEFGDVPEVLLKAREALLKRVRTDPKFSAESVDFAFNCMRSRGEVMPEDSLVMVVNRMRHLSGQFTVLGEGHQQLLRRRWQGEELQQAYFELFRGLAEHPMWLCEDDGTPSVSAACANILSRCKWRSGDRVAGQRKVTSFEEWQGWHQPEHGRPKLLDLIADAKSKLSARDFETFRIIVVCECEAITLYEFAYAQCRNRAPRASEEALRAEAKRAHDALRARVSRFRREGMKLLRDFLDEDEVA